MSKYRRVLQYFSANLSLLAERLTATKRRRAALPLFLAVFFCCLNLWVFPKFESFYNELGQIDLGGFFLAGLPFNGIALNMPFAEIVVALALHLGITPDILYIILHMGVYALVFFTGCLLRGYWAGILALLAAGLFGGGSELVYEQAMYSFFLLLVLAYLLQLRSERTMKNSLLCGLAAGASMLIRTPLFLFVPLAILCDRLSSGESKAVFTRRSLVFLAACYILLVPWGRLNYSVSGKFSLVDTQRSYNNIITAAMGSIYTAYGDTGKAAGLIPGDSAFYFYLREAAKRPLHFTLTILRRLWHIFLLYPLLFTLLLLAIALSREREKALIFCLPVYFVLIHSALAIEKRYFYPLTYLLPPLLAGTFLPRSSDELPEAYGFARKAVSAAFWLSFTAVLCVEALVIAYPGRAARAVIGPDTYARASQRFPNDRALYGMKCAELWLNGSDDGYRGCLGEYGLKFQDKSKSYFVAVIDSRSPLEIPFPSYREIHGNLVFCYTVKMLREFELGDRAAALASLNRAYTALNPTRALSSSDWQHMEPYKDDKALRSFIRSDTDRFWDRQAYDILLMWPPERMAKILKEVSLSVPLSPRLSRLAATLKASRSAGEADVQLRRRLRDDIVRPAPPAGASQNP